MMTGRLAVAPTTRPRCLLRWRSARTTAAATRSPTRPMGGRPARASIPPSRWPAAPTVGALFPVTSSIAAIGASRYGSDNLPGVCWLTGKTFPVLHVGQLGGPATPLAAGVTYRGRRALPFEVCRIPGWLGTPPPCDGCRREVCRDYPRSSRLEWLLTSGTGGFAMGTVAGANTRRYHGLLVASLHPPVERRSVTLARLEETALLSAGRAAAGGQPVPGHALSRRVPAADRRSAGTAARCGAGRSAGVEIERRVLLVPGAQTVVVRYASTAPVRLRLEPLLAFRDYHGLVHRNDAAWTGFEERTRAGVAAGAVPAIPLAALAVGDPPAARPSSPPRPGTRTSSTSRSSSGASTSARTCCFRGTGSWCCVPGAAAAGGGHRRRPDGGRPRRAGAATSSARRDGRASPGPGHGWSGLRRPIRSGGSTGARRSSPAIPGSPTGGGTR